MKTIHTSAAPPPWGRTPRPSCPAAWCTRPARSPSTRRRARWWARTSRSRRHRALKNVAAVLAAAGSGLEKVVKTTCFLADMADFAAFNAVYAEYFPNKPARSCVAAKELPKGALLRGGDGRRGVSCYNVRRAVFLRGARRLPTKGLHNTPASAQIPRLAHIARRARTYFSCVTNPAARLT